MYKIIVRLPGNRDFAGSIQIENSAGRRIAGPFPICGRADDKLARENKNPNRDPLLPFGDTPLGEYQLKEIIASGNATPYSAEEFGSSGIVLLQPGNGAAALADANGRFGFFIQGGALSRKGLLRPTDGSLRLSNKHQRELLAVLQQLNGAGCKCQVVECAKKGKRIAVTATTDVLSQSKTVLSKLFGAGVSLPQRSLMQKMLLAGRISISIPSLLILSTHASFGQHASGIKKETLLASRHAISFPVMFAAATDTGAGHDYSGIVSPGEQLKDAPNSPAPAPAQNPTAPLTPFDNNQPQNPDLTPAQKPSLGGDTKPMDQAHSIQGNIPNLQQNPGASGLGFDTAGGKVGDVNSSTVTVPSPQSNPVQTPGNSSTPQSPAGNNSGVIDSTEKYNAHNQSESQRVWNEYLKSKGLPAQPANPPATQPAQNSQPVTPPAAPTPPKPKDKGTLPTLDDNSPPPPPKQ